MAALLLASGPVTAAGPRAYLDHLYFVIQGEVEETVPGTGNGFQTGAGIGIKGLVPVTQYLVFTGEAQAVEYHGGGSLGQVRLGAGLLARRSGVFVEYIKTDDALEAAGPALHLRLGGRDLYAQVGYLSLDDRIETNTGYEYAAGFAAMVDGNLGAFFDVRHTALEGEDTGIKLVLTDFRIGLRFMFPR
ncbi:MAG: hypothetical protein ACREE7_08460 [Dongiaceae bacterium]